MSVAIGELSDEQLSHLVLDRERDLVTLRFQHALNQLENTGIVKTVRRDIARLLTETRNREVGQGLSKGSLVGAHRNSYVPGVAMEAAQSAGGQGFLKGVVDKISATE